MNDIYTAPDAPLTTPSESEFGSLEKGINGDYQLQFKAVLSEGWDKVKGAKGTLWGAMLLAMLFSIAISTGITFALQFSIGQFSSTLAAVLNQFLLMLITTPVTAGMMLLGIRRAGGANIRATSVFDHFGKILPLFLAMILVYIFIAIGYVLLIIPGIYLSVAYIFTMPLIIEKNLSPWAAMEASRKAVTKSWFTIFGILFVAMLILMLSFITIIGFIWAIPWMMLTMGVMYRTIFGIEQSTLDSE